VSRITWEAYVRTAPSSLAKIAEPVKVDPPTQEMTAADINPLKSEKNQKILKKLRSICMALPEVIEDSQFGNPAFRAGKKSFCNLSGRTESIKLQIWVGPERQLSLISFDDRFSIPAYVGHNGWIDLDLTSVQNWEEIETLLLASYEHFALKRMLKALAETEE
jgi:predicted DNA-binding protein (MmcQ/YjbR family)